MIKVSNTFKPLITVVVPIYNGEKTLKRCIESIIGQTYENLEVLLINDGSTDGSLDVLRTYENKDSRIKLITKFNSGVSSARNTGIESSNGELILFVDCDDFLEKDALNIMYKYMLENSVELVRTMYYIDYIHKTVKVKLNIQPGRYTKERLLDLIPEFLSGNEKCYTGLLLIERKAINKAGMFNESVHLMEDTLFYIKLILAVDSMYISEKPTYHATYDENGASKSKNKLEFNIGQVLLVNKEMTETLLKGKVINKQTKSILDSSHFKIILSYLSYIYMISYGIGAKEFTSNLSNISTFKKLMVGLKAANKNYFNKFCARLIEDHHYYVLKLIFNAKFAIKRLVRFLGEG